jgi:predicted negative regulator of RcsB-dependent stress response
MEQDLFNYIVGTLLAILGWFGKTLWDAVQALKEDLKDIEVDLPSTYVKKTELDNRLQKIETMLDKIFDRLDSKVDKHD